MTECGCDLTGMLPPAVHIVDGHPDPQPETPTPGRCQRCGDQYGPWDMTWTCEHCLGGDA